MAQRLDPGPAGGISHYIDREKIAPSQRVTAADVEQHEGQRQVPDGLVEKRRLVVATDLLAHPSESAGLGVARQHIDVVDLELPRQAGRAAVELIVEPVPPPADPLGRDDSGGGSVGEGRETNIFAATTYPRPDTAKGDRAPDAESAVPDLEGIDRMSALGEVQLGIGDDVIQPTTDDPENNRPASDIPH